MTQEIILELYFMNIYTKSFYTLSIRGCTSDSNLNIFYLTCCSSNIWDTLRVILRFDEWKNKRILFCCLFKILSSYLGVVCLVNNNLSIWRCWNTLSWFLRFLNCWNWSGDLFRCWCLSWLNFGWILFRYFSLLWFNWLNRLFCLLNFFCKSLLFFHDLWFYFFYIYSINLLHFILNYWSYRFLLFWNVFIFALIIDCLNDLFLRLHSFNILRCCFIFNLFNFFNKF